MITNSSLAHFVTTWNIGKGMVAWPNSSQGNYILTTLMFPTTSIGYGSLCFLSYLVAFCCCAQFSIPPLRDKFSVMDEIISICHWDATVSPWGLSMLFQKRSRGHNQYFGTDSLSCSAPFALFSLSKWSSKHLEVLCWAFLQHGGVTS